MFWNHTHHWYQRRAFRLLLMVVALLSGCANRPPDVQGWVATGGAARSSVYPGGVATDLDGNVYIGGAFEGTARFGELERTAKGSTDAFVGKLSAGGNYVWVVSVGDSRNDSVEDIAVDAAGNIYVVGRYSGRVQFGDATLSSDMADDQSGPEHEVFVAKISSEGKWLWALRGPAGRGWSIGVDSHGASYVAGTLYGGTSSFGSNTITSRGGEDVFVAKVSTSGGWEWSVGAGSSSPFEEGTSIAVNPDGSSYVAGVINAPAVFGVQAVKTSYGSADLFVANMTTSGDVAWVTVAGGDASERDARVTVGADGGIYLAGRFSGTATFGSTSLTAQDGEATALAKLSFEGSVEWSVAVSGIGINDVLVDGAVYGVGTMSATLWQDGRDVATSKGSQDVMLTEFSAIDGRLNDVRHAEASAGSAATDVAVDRLGAVLVLGQLRSNVAFGSTDVSPAGAQDVFVWKSAL